MRDEPAGRPGREWRWFDWIKQKEVKPPPIAPPTLGLPELDGAEAPADEAFESLGFSYGLKGRVFGLGASGFGFKLEGLGCKHLGLRPWLTPAPWRSCGLKSME